MSSQYGPLILMVLVILIGAVAGTVLGNFLSELLKSKREVK